MSPLEKEAASESDNRPLRVVLYEPAGRGGVCHYTHQLGEHLARAGADVTVITTENYELEHLERHFRVEYLFSRSRVTRLRQRLKAFGWSRDRKGSRSRRGDASIERVGTTGEAVTREAGSSFLRRLRIRLLHLRTLYRFARRRPDVVHFQWLVDRSQDTDFIERIRRLGIPVLYTAHDVEPHGPASPEETADLRRLYASVSKIVVHAESNKRKLHAKFGVETSKIHVIPHGSYDFLCDPGTLDQAAARERIGVPREKKVILFFGLIKRYKGLEYLVEAFGEVRGRVGDSFLLIVGDIFAGDPEGHRFYSELIDGLKDRADVLCVASYVPLDTVGSYLAAADVVVLPYTRTSQSGVLLAAYAAGRPVVVTDTGGLSEVVEEGKSGLIVPTGDAKALSEAIIEILSDARRREAMGKRARFLATEVYGWEAVASRTLGLYESVLSERPS